MALLIDAVALFVAVAISITAFMRLSEPVSISPWLMPLLVGTIMAIVSGALLVRDMLERQLAVRTATAVSDDEQHRGSGARMAGWLALSTGYTIAVPLTGFVGATLIFLILALRLFGKAGWKTIVAVSLSIALLLPLLFRYVFFTLVP